MRSAVKERLTEALDNDASDAIAAQAFARLCVDEVLSRTDPVVVSCLDIDTFAAAISRAVTSTIKKGYPAASQALAFKLTFDLDFGNQLGQLLKEKTTDPALNQTWGDAVRALYPNAPVEVLLQPIQLGAAMARHLLNEGQSLEHLEPRALEIFAALTQALPKKMPTKAKDVQASSQLLLALRNVAHGCASRHPQGMADSALKGIVKQAQKLLESDGGEVEAVGMTVRLMAQIPTSGGQARIASV